MPRQAINEEQEQFFHLPSAAALQEAGAAAFRAAVKRRQAQPNNNIIKCIKTQGSCAGSSEEGCRGYYSIISLSSWEADLCVSVCARELFIVILTHFTSI